MLTIKHFVCCGVYVHKKFVVATIVKTDYQGITSYTRIHFPTFKSELNKLQASLLQYNYTEICMESTCNYWILIFNIPEYSCHVVVSTPKYVRAIKCQKTNNKDSALIAALFKFDIFPSSNSAGKK